MRQASKRVPDSAEKTVRDIRRATRRHHSAEEKIRIVLEGLRGEDRIAELCRKEGVNQNQRKWTLHRMWLQRQLHASLRLGDLPFVVGRGPVAREGLPPLRPDLKLDDTVPFRLSRNHFMIEKPDGN